MRRNGRPYSGSPVFLEGMPSTYSDSDGSFRFENVPIGLRWLMAYEPGDYLNEDSISINVSTNGQKTGNLLLMDYREGCSTNRGIYLSGR